ncbi:hypothetical protein GCM10020367_35570 [Streptomyces sannanensis]|uniref:Secreted protein n=2 Tax=Streptomyces sannanensis TaxID=285536 RepID=A0ABP6SEG0_9ACTN
MALRVLVAVAAAASVTGAVLMRNWDRAAGRRVAELTRARANDQWRTEERLAELEAELEESRELRTRLDAKLRTKRREIAGLRGEHAALLRRYANAETERASALEGRRQLAVEAAPKALPATSPGPTPADYLAAAKALDNLSRAGRHAEEPQGEPVAAAGPDEHVRPSSALSRVPVASPVVPYTAPRRPVPPTGSFDFFGMHKQQATAALESVQDEDLADVVGEEALAAQKAADSDRAVGEVIDLTEHDETEQLDVVELRTAIS